MLRQVERFRPAVGSGQSSGGRLPNMKATTVVKGKENPPSERNANILYRILASHGNFIAP